MNNSTEEIEDNQVSPLLVAFGSVVVLYIIVANSVLIACFMINRSRVWNDFTRQVCNLAISDLLVGLAGIPLLVVSDIRLAPSFNFCITAFYMLFSTQNGTLLNILGICIQRLFVLHTVPQQSALEINSTRNIVILVGSWAISFLITSLPFIVWGRSDFYYPNTICVSHLVFGPHFQQALKVLFAMYLIPLLFTDVLYTCAAFRLCCIWSQKVFPGASGQTNPTSSTNQSATTTSVSSLRTGQMSLRRQRAVFGTIGILLLLLNVFTLPIILIISLEQTGQKVPRDIRWFTTLMYMFNSAVNPIVYAVRIKSLRDGLRRMFLGCWSMLH